MTSYGYYDVLEDNVLDRNHNRPEQAKVIRADYRREYSDDEDDRSHGLRGRSQSLKDLNERVDSGPISRSKSLRDVDTGDFDTVKAKVSYVDSWNPVSHVGRGRIAKRIQSWENMDPEEEALARRSMNGSRSSSVSRSHSYKELRQTESEFESVTRRSSGASWREDRYEATEAYSQETSEFTYDADAFGRDPDTEQGEHCTETNQDEMLPSDSRKLPDIKMPDTDPTSADAEWKKIQQNTFTRWCNEHLKCVNKYIYNLETDLVDGLKLIALLQVLSHKKIARFNKKPTFRPQKLENISIGLKFIEGENIRLVNIDASDIFKGNIKLILGLIWTLILKYQISMPYLDDDDDEGQKMTPKQALLAWVRSKMPESVPMDNFNKDWSDGRAIACLVDSIAPGLFPECEDLDPADKLENARQAMKAAEDWLGVPQVITPEEITNPNVDELSVMTYVSYFPEAKLKPGAPLRPRTHPSSKCSAKGPGVEPKGLVVKKPAEFTVFTQGAGVGKLGVSVWGPGKVEEEVRVQDNHDHTYSCQYFPQKQGKFDVHVKWNGRHIPKSPFRVEVSQDLDASQAYASGPGLQPEGIQAGKYTEFTVYTKGAGEGQVSVKVIDPRGGEDVDIIIEPQDDGQYFVEYQPVNAGKHTIKVLFGGQPISKSPFHVMVSPPRVEPNPSKVRVFGSGVEPTGLKAGQRAPFTVDAKGAGDGELDVFVEGPQGEEKVDVKNNGDGTYSCVYFPAKFGRYVVNVTWSSVQVPNSPFNVKVAPAVDASRIRAYGPGLEKGVAGKPCEFTVETKGAGIESLGFAIEGPSQAEIHCQERTPGICDVKYYPTTPGQYAIHVTCGEEDIPKSPFMVPISPAGDAKKVYAKGPGLEPEGVVSGVPAEFTIFTKDAGEGEVDVRVIDSSGKKVPADITDNKDGTYTVIYYPTTIGSYTVNVTFNSESIPKSPFRVNVCQTNPSACRAYGPGLEKGFVNQNNEFKIETKGAGEGGLGLTIEGPSEAQIECKDNGDGSCDVNYLPPDSGDYLINILFADQHIPGSPFKARISYPFDASKVKVDGPGIEPGVRAGEPADIDVDTRLAGDAELKVEVVDDLNKPVQCDIDEEEFGIYAVTYYPKKKGGHKVNVKYGGKHAPGSPFKVPISPKSDASKVKVQGPGVEPTGVNPGKPTWFTINASEAGKGDVHVKVEPVGRGRPVDKVTVEDEGKDTFKCEYVAPLEGAYQVDVKFDGDPVPGSPFPVQVAKPGDAGKCKASGDGLETAVIDQLAEFDVDCKAAGEGQLMASVDNPSGRHTDTLVTDNEDGTYSVSYTPFEEGPHTLNVKFGGDHIPGSPYKVDVLPPTDATKCKAYGPGLEGAFVGKPADFTVETKGAGAGGLSLAIEGPSEAKLTCNDHGDGTCSVRYTPTEPGDYEIHIRFADEHIPGSPFNTKVTRPVDVSKVKCYGPGVDRVNPLFSKTPQEFTVDTSEAGDADLKVTVETPSRRTLKPEPVCEKGDGVYTVAYTPEDEGRYTVNVKYADKDVPNSPFRVRAGPPFDASKVKVSGPGIDETPSTDEPVQFLCDCTEAGVAPLTATVSPPTGPDVPVDIKENGDGTYTVEYTPERPGRHSIDVKYGGKRVPRSPFRVQVAPGGDASKVKVDGLGPNDRLVVGKENDFTIDTRDAGKGTPKCVIKGPNRKEVPVDMINNGDGTYDCEFIPEVVGRHDIDVLFSGVPVPGSPFSAKAEKPVDIDKIKCNPKADKEPIVNEELVYAIDASKAESAPGEGLINGNLLTPSGDKEPVRVKDNRDGTYDVMCVPKEPGPHELAVDYDGVPLVGSPFKFDAVEGGADKVKAYGKGLERGLAGEPCDFTIVTKDAGPGGLSLAVHGPSKAEITCTDNGDGTCSVQYVPDEPGDYDISCKFADQDIPGSPFTAHIYSNYDDMDAAPRPTVGKPCDVELKIPESFRPEDVKNGVLTATLERPNGSKEPLEPLRVNDDGTLAVTFIPYEPGEHLIHVKKNGREVQNSPFSVMVQAQRVGDVYPVGHTCDLDFKVPEDIKDLIATLKRPSGKVDESLTLLPGPKPGTISVSFVPREAGEHYLSIKRKKDGSPIAGSPFSILVESEEPVEGVGCPVDYCFSLDDVTLPDDIEKKRLKATLKRPSSDKEEPVDLKLNSDNTLSCSFVPRETGLHYIYIRKYGRHVDGSPFVIKVTAPEGVSSVGKPYGKGLESPDINLPDDYPRLSAALKRPSSPKEEELRLVLNGDNTLGVAFTPREEGEHLIHLRKDKKDVQSSPFSVMVGAKEEKVEEVHPMGRTCDVNLDIQGVKLPEDLEKDLLRGFLKRPNSTKEEPLKLEITRDNSLGVSFVPQEPGEHQISVRKKGRNREWQDVPGSPFSIMVEAAEAVNAVGTPCDCLLDIPGVSMPDDLRRLVATLKRPSGRKEEDLKLRVTSDNKPFVSFVPREPGEHLISIKKYGRHVTNSPFSVMVVAPEGGNAIGRPCGVGLEIPGLKLPDDYTNGLLTASLKRPSGKPEEPLPLALNSDNTLSVSFTPQETGEHFVTVKKSDSHVNGSPFSVMVSGPGPADPSKVVVSGPGLHDGVAGKPSNFTINTRDAGYGGLGLSIEVPSKAQITCTDNEDGTCTVEYLPVEPGKYTINVKFADEDVPGSPFTSNVRGTGEEPIMVAEENLVSSSAPGQFSEPTQRVSEVFEDLVTFGSTPAQPHDFVFDLKGYKMEDLETKVYSPDGTELDSEIVETSPKTYTIRFVPKESGEHTIYVKYRNRDIPGSPFKVFVEAPVWGGAAKCLAAGPGLERGVVNHPSEFTVWTRDAGPGGLAIAVEGPAKSEIKCTDNGDGSCNISYLPTCPGEYTTHIRFADEDIPGSPFKVLVSPEMEDRFRDLNVSDIAESGLKVGQPASFSVQTNAAVGDVTASVLAPSGDEKEAQVSKLGGGNYAIRFTPREFGDHLVNVRFDGAHIPGSPFKIRVGGAEGHPEKVKAYGEGLRSGRVGQSADFTVNALEAGSGALALSVDGPAKVKMNCSENADGTYQVNYNPVVAGEYTIRIKFAGHDIPGSPYNVTIHPADGKYRSDGDASKCTSRGTGLHHAVLGQPNSFTVNASNAGRGSLMVGVEGPAIPAKEINVKHTGSNVYAVNYALEESGTYILKVLWGDKHIPGSPFHVTV